MKSAELKKNVGDLPNTRASLMELIPNEGIEFWGFFVFRWFARI